MLRDLLVRAALGMLAGAIAVSCMGQDNSSPENVGSVQLALAGSAAGGMGAGGAPDTAGAGGVPAPVCDPTACAALGACMYCNPNNDKCEAYKAGDNHQCDTATEPCDVDDFCAGGATCPDEVEDAGTDCGGAPNAANLCDLQDTCDGMAKTCPNKVKTAGTDCRAVAGSCDKLEECDGVSIDCPTNTYQDTSVSCRPAVGDCDVADNCPGNGPNCTSPDVKVANDTPCASTDKCNLTASCQAGLCIGLTFFVCPPPPGPNAQCLQAGVCDPGDGACDYANKPNGATCSDGITCTEGDACGNGVCNPGTERDALCPPHDCAAVTCDVTATNINDRCVIDASAAAGERCNSFVANACDVEETCNGTNPDCPTDGVAVAGTICLQEACSAAAGSFLYQPPAVCDGLNKTCAVTAQQSCNGYACDAAVCRTDCTGDQDCDAGHYCANGICEARIGAGEPCDDDSQCSAGATHCVDGVCCNTACGNQCEACDVSGAEGTCSPVTGAPHGDREACAGDGSACNGTCNGQLTGACDFLDEQTVCQDAACDAATSVAVEQAFCDGVGSCATTDPVECAPFVCGASACRGDCVTDAQCAAGAFCKAGVCTPTQDPGGKCTRDAQCTSGFCTDGVCCSARCDGQCEACSAAGSCGAVSGEPVGQRAPCAGASGDACAGACDGGNRTTCSYPGAAIVCRDASCVDGEATVAAHCSGAGACAAAQTVACLNGCEGDICAGDACLVDANCAAGEQCVAGTCAPQGEPGATCSSANDCSSGFCVDGVCCDSACDGQCEACDAPNSAGECVAIDGAPHGSRPACTSDGSACGGTCDGDDRNGCSYASGTVCAPGTCMPGQDGAEAVATVESQCNGSGRCPAPRQQACGGAGCDAAEQLCNGDCADGSACPSGEYCSAGICVTTDPNGTACQADAQCASQHCVDGYCCGSACDDRCAACDVPGQLGQCSPVTGNTHGGRPGCQGGGVCGAQCDGQRVTDCAFPDDDTSCAEPYCHDGAQVDASVCDGAGQCRAGEQTECPAFACDGDQCSAACETDTDCTRTFQCQEGTCVAPYLINAVDEGTCGCRAAGAGPERQGGFWLLAAASLWSLRRRRAAKSRPFATEALR